MARRMLFCAATLAATLCLVSCSDGSTGGTPGGGTSSGGTSSGGTSSGGGNGGGSGGGGGGDDGFAYTPWGPDDPPIPGQYANFAATSAHELNCGRVEDQAPGGEFWEVALAVCKAIRGDQPWPERTTVPDPPDPENTYQGCLDAELLAMLQRALRWHADHPDGQPKISYPGRSSTSSCQSRIYEVRVLTVRESEDLDLGHEGKIAVGIIAPPGPDPDNELAATVTVNGQRSDESDAEDNGPRGQGVREVVVFLEPAPQPRKATIKVFNGRATMSASAELPGDGGSTTSSGTSSPTSSPTESPAPPEQSGRQTVSSSASAPPG
jgi:hypothetical protein